LTIPGVLVVVYRELKVISTIIPTLDTHRSRQIFNRVWLVDKGNTLVHTDIPCADVISTSGE
jgi:hypothetical protein